MKILVIDGQGGGLGRQLVSTLKVALPESEIIAVGTNALATSAMLKAGAEHAATGENAVVVNCRILLSAHLASPLRIPCMERLRQRWQLLLDKVPQSAFLFP